MPVLALSFTLLHCLWMQDPARIAGAAMLQDDLNNVLLTLTDREAGIVRMRFGLDDGVEKTLEEVGKAFNVSEAWDLARDATHHSAGLLCDNTAHRAAL